MSALLAHEPLMGHKAVVVTLDHGRDHGPRALVSVPWTLSERDAQTTAAGAAALLLLAPDDVRVLSRPVGAARSLTDTLKAVAVAIREGRA